MTYFLDDAPIPFKPRGNDVAPSTWAMGLGAAFKKAALENDANFVAARTDADVRMGRASQAAGILGRDWLVGKLEERNTRARDAGMPSQVKEIPETIDEMIEAMGPNGARLILDEARQAAAVDPAKWANLDLTEEGILREANGRLQADYKEAEEILGMMPGGGTAEFIGGMAGITADVKNVPFLLLGGPSGSFLRVMGREAMLNVSAELSFLPSQFTMADRLEIDDPNIARNLMFAAVGGAVFGGAFEAGSRALRYFSGRSEVKPLPGFSKAETDVIVTAAEDAIARGEDPVKAIAEAVSALPVERPPLIEPPQVAQPTAEARVAQREADIADAESAFDTDFPEMKPKYPLAEMIKRMGGIAAKRLNRATGDMEPSFAAQELANMGVTQRTHPFMFRKNGHTDFDNIVASEHPGLRETVRFDPETGYFDRDDLIGALGRELSTGNKHPLSGEIEARRREIDELHSSDYRSAEEDALDGNRAEDGFFVDHKTYGFREDDYIDMSRRFDEWAERRGFTALLSPDERGEILTHLDTRGGDAEYLVESVLNRKRKFVDGPEAGKADETEALGREGADEGRPVPRQEAGGRGGPDGSATAYRAEETAAGQQSIIPGVEPITQRQRLEAAQNTPKRGMDRPMDTGLFDMGARQQMDMFSDPMSREARAVQGNIAADIRDQIEADGDFLVDIGDGKGERPASSVLDDLDAGDKASARMDLCGKFSTDIPF